MAAASRAASRRAPSATSSPANNRWVSKALASRGGADEPAEETAEGIPGVLSEVEVALSSFNDIVGENLLVVDNPKKGTTKEVSFLNREDTRGLCGVTGTLVELVWGCVCV